MVRCCSVDQRDKEREWRIYFNKAQDNRKWFQQRDHIQMSMFVLAVVVQIAVTIIGMFFVRHHALTFLIIFDLLHFYILICVLSHCESVKEESPLLEENCYQSNIVAVFEKAQVRVWKTNLVISHDLQKISLSSRVWNKLRKNEHKNKIASLINKSYRLDAKSWVFGLTTSRGFPF